MPSAICDCGATVFARFPGPRKCLRCGEEHRIVYDAPVSPSSLPVPLIASQRRAICETCEHRRDEQCGVIRDRDRAGGLWHPRGLPRAESRCPDGRWTSGYVGTIPVAGAAIITTHWNPHRFRRLAATYHEWRPTIAGVPIVAVELVLDGGPPDLRDSRVIRGGPQNLCWQKERLINLAISALPPSVRYVAWVDHDECFEDPHWLSRSIDLLDSGVDVLQPWNRNRYLDRRGRQIAERPSATGALAAGARADVGHGGAWVARRDWLEAIGGLYDRNIVGGGDAVFFSAVTGTPSHFLARQPAALQADASRWIDAIPPTRWAHLDGVIRHLWHGDRDHRQYISRDEILRRHRYAPARHITVDAQGLLAWTDEAPAAMRREIAGYFLARREDG